MDLPTIPRVGALYTSHNATAPRVVRNIKKIHQRTTRSNIPMNFITKDPDIQEVIPLSEWADDWYNKPRQKSVIKQPNTPKKASPYIPKPYRPARNTNFVAPPPLYLIFTSPLQKVHHLRGCRLLAKKRIQLSRRIQRSQYHKDPRKLRIINVPILKCL